MEIKYSKKFKKQFKKLPANVVSSFKKRFKIFLVESNNPILRIHKLQGEYKSHKSLNITGDYRLVFKVENGVLYLEAIGTHSELYE